MAKGKPTVVVVSLQIKICRPLKGLDRALCGLDAVQSQVANVVISLKSARHEHAHTLLCQAQRHDPGFCLLAQRIGVTDLQPPVVVQRLADLLKHFWLDFGRLHGQRGADDAHLAHPFASAAGGYA